MLSRLACCVLFAFAAASVTADEWTPLFNGKDLSGWTPKIRSYDLGDNYADTFRVEDGLLKVRFDKYDLPYRDRFGHLFYEKSYSHYRLRVECRSVGEQVEGGAGWAFRNNGLMLHSQAPASMGLDQSFPVSLELQILAARDDGRPRTTANLCTPGTHVKLDGKLHTPHCTDSTSPTIPHGDWVTIEAEVHGGQRVRHFVNGQQVLEFTDPVLDENDADAKRLLADGAAKSLSEGFISIQAESAPYDFRKIEIMPLDAE